MSGNEVCVQSVSWSLLLNFNIFKIKISLTLYSNRREQAAARTPPSGSLELQYYR
jgi:hypothetical protein